MIAGNGEGGNAGLCPLTMVQVVDLDVGLAV